MLMFARKDETSRCARDFRNLRLELRRRKIGYRLLLNGLIALFGERFRFGFAISGPAVGSFGGRRSAAGSCVMARLPFRSAVPVRLRDFGALGRSLGGWWRRRRLWRLATFAAVRCADRASAGIAGKGRSSDASCLCRLERPDAKSVNTRDAGVGDKSIRCLFYGCVAHYNTST